MFSHAEVVNFFICQIEVQRVDRSAKKKTVGLLNNTKLLGNAKCCE